MLDTEKVIKIIINKLVIENMSLWIKREIWKTYFILRHKRSFIWKVIKGIDF
jgi:hypothetical protein